MTTYNYKCPKCENVFDIEATVQEKAEGGEKFICPNCGSREIKENISTLDFIKNLAADYESGDCCSDGTSCDISCRPDASKSNSCCDEASSGGRCG